jgi:hypothetical protein
VTKPGLVGSSPVHTAGLDPTSKNKKIIFIYLNLNFIDLFTTLEL